MRTKGLGKTFSKIKQILSFQEFMGIDDPFPEGEVEDIRDPYRIHAWVNIAISTLMRNIGRASFRITRDGEFVYSGAVFELFRDVNPVMNRFDLWKATSAWWFLEGEAFWFFGDSYNAGIPREIFVLNPRKVRVWTENGSVIRWFYSTEKGEVPILPDEIIHFREWNPWNEIRGVTPLIALSQEIEQDNRSNSSTTKLLRNNAVPEGVLKTDQVLREEEADRLEKRWESIYGKKGKARRIAVLGKGTSFEPITMTPTALKFFDLKRWNLYTILAKYGIPPRVAHVQDSQSAFSGKDTAEQHAAFWKYTIIPTLRNYEQIIETQFFSRFGLKEEGVFDTSDIPELQESEAERSKRDIAEIGAGLKTINDVLLERGLEPKSWGDTWYRSSKLIPVTGSEGKSSDIKSGEDARKEKKALCVIYEQLEKKEKALLSVYKEILYGDEVNVNEELKKLSKACISAGIEEIFRNFEAVRTIYGLYINEITNEAIRIWSRRNLLAKPKRDEVERQYISYIHSLIDDARVFAIGKLGSRYYRFISKSKYGSISSERKTTASRNHYIFNFKTEKDAIENREGFSLPFYGDET